MKLWIWVIIMRYDCLNPVGVKEDTGKVTCPTRYIRVNTTRLRVTGDTQNTHWTIHDLVVAEDAVSIN